MREFSDVSVAGLIRLGQFLKYSGAVEDGFTARLAVQGGDVMVNGEVETRRGTQLANGDLVELSLPNEVVKLRVSSAS